MISQRSDSISLFAILIKELIQKAEISRLHLGVDLDKSNFEYRVLNLYAADGIHLSQVVNKLLLILGIS